MKDHLYEETVKSTNIYKGKIVDLNLLDVRLPNGKDGKREVINHPGAVAVIALTEDNKLVLVRQFRKPLEKHLIEIPAGKLEEGEDPSVTVARELEEETGYKAKEFQKITSFYTSPGFADELVHIYEAKGLMAGTAGTDEDEFVDVLEVTLEEAEELMEKQEIHDAKTAYALQYLKLKLC
ncbi:NUDIX hydrolase [Thalassorhabdus alkalitolerans]|uniref:NUDIX hydrolase n=1 Tax=Thalassorhabdus alkalitolerans TaxID=2282697 RepID=A0ABW0YQR6_9BACI